MTALSSSPNTAAAGGPLTLSTKSLPTLPSPSASPSYTKVSITRPSSILISLPPTSTIKRDSTLSNNPNNLPFASAAFAELHRRRVSSARALTATRPTSHNYPFPPIEAATRPASPTPPPLPPKHETLQFPDGTRVRASSISTPFAAMTSVPGFSTDRATPWSLKPPILTTKRASNRVSFLTKTLKSKILRRMTLPLKPAPEGKKRTRVANLTHKIPHGAKVSSLDDPASFSDDSEPHHCSASSGREEDEDEDDGEDDCMSPYGNGAADADDESEGVVRYAERATFRRPIVVQYSAGQPKVEMREVLETGPLPIDLGPDLGLEVGRDRRSVDGEAEAEARLARRLAEDQAMERTWGEEEEGKAEEDSCWSDVVYDESIVDELLRRRQEEDVEEREEKERPGSAMSELDSLVRDSLLIAHDTSLIRPSDELVDERKSRVSFTKPADVEANGEYKGVVVIGPSTPYPYGVKEGDEPYGFRINVEVAPEHWEMRKFGGRSLSTDGDKARKVLGLVDADESLGLD